MPERQCTVIGNVPGIRYLRLQTFRRAKLRIDSILDQLPIAMR
jgi:hypothetical protein